MSRGLAVRPELPLLEPDPELPLLLVLLPEDDVGERPEEADDDDPDEDDELSPLSELLSPRW